MALPTALPRADRPKADVGAAIAELNQLGVAIKIITVVNGIVAAKVCQDIGVDVDQFLIGAELAVDGDVTLMASARSSR